MRVTLTRDYRKISASYGLFQNLTPDANIELTENVQSEGIILKPFQTVMINRTIYARKLSGAGVGVLAILPFADAEESSDGETSDDTGETDFTEETAPPLPPKPRPPIPPHHVHANPYDCFGHEPFPKPPPGFDGHRPPPPHDDDGYVIQIPRELVERGQRKFVVEF